MKFICSFLVFTFLVPAMAQRVRKVSDSYTQIQEITLDQFGDPLLQDKPRFRSFLDAFFRDFTAHPKTKIKKLQRSQKCQQTYCYDLELDYYYFAKDDERNQKIQSKLSIVLSQNSAVVILKNHIPEALKAIIKITPDSWIENFPIMDKAEILLDQKTTGLNLKGTVITHNKVKHTVLWEFVNDLLSSFYFHLDQIAKTP